MRVLPFRSRCGGSGAALVAAAILVALGCPSPAHALTVGFLDPTLQTQDNARFWSDMTTLRAGVVRYDVYWNEIAPARPAQPARPGLGRVPLGGARPAGGRRRGAHGRDRADAVAHAALGAGRQRPRRQAEPVLVGAAAVDWRAFVYAAAVRYSGTFDPDGVGYGGPLPRVRFWEMWNEPNYIGALARRSARAASRGRLPRHLHRAC